MARVLATRTTGTDSIVLNPGVAQPLHRRGWEVDLTRLTAFDTSVDLVTLGPHRYDSHRSRSGFPPAVLLVAVASGRIQGLAGRDSFEVLPGQALLVDTRRPLRSQVDEDVRLLRLVVDQRRIMSGLPPHDPITTSVLTDSPVVSSCLGAISTLLHRSQSVSPEDDDAAVAHLLSGLQLALLDESIRQHTNAGEGAAFRTRREEIEHHIATHLGDPALAPAELASALGLSVRSVHAAFVGSPDTVSATIRRLRIERLVAALDGHTDRAHIADLTAALGFRSSAQMTRAFKAVTGMPFHRWLRHEQSG